MVAFFIIFLPLLIFISIASYVIISLALQGIFKKAKIANTWAAWVPVYNNWKILEIGGQRGFWAIINFVPIINIVSTIMSYIAIYNINLKLGKGIGFYILFVFFPIIWLLIAAFDKSTWNDSLGSPSLAQPAVPTKPSQPTTIV